MVDLLFICLDLAALLMLNEQIKSKLVQQEVSHTVILPPCGECS